MNVSVTTAVLVLLFMGSAPSITGCAGRIQRMYGGPELSASELAILHDSRRVFVSSLVSVVSVDGQRVEPTVARYSLLPGSHRCEVWVDRLSPVSLIILHDVYYTDAVCAFELNTVPGSSYELVDVDSGSHGEREMYKATLELRRRVGDGGAEAMNVPAECAGMDVFEHGRFEIPHDLARGGLLCRTSAECLKDGAVCTIRNGYIYGTCQ